MKKLFIFLLLAVVFAAGVNAKAEFAADAEKIETFFPLTEGRVFKYKIQVFDEIPLSSIEIWSKDGEDYLYHSRSTIPMSANRAYDLIFQIGKEAMDDKNISRLFPEEKAKAMEVKILKDELGLYKFAQKLYWVYSPEEEGIFEVFTLPPDYPYGPAGATDGAVKKYILFARTIKHQSMSRTLMGNLSDVAIYYGMIKLNGEDCKKFGRRAREQKDLVKKYVLFKEESIFCSDKGLTYLKQTVVDTTKGGKKTTMIWSLR